MWVGKGATHQEKTQSMQRAQDFIATKNYPQWTGVQRIVEGAETAPFKQYFARWREQGSSHARLARAANDEGITMSTKHFLNFFLTSRQIFRLRQCRRC